MPSNTKMTYLYLRRASLMHPSWIFLFTLCIFIFTQWETSLFGLIPNEPLQGFLSFAPHQPWREWGLSLFTYPLVHESLQHWFINSILWMIFARKVYKRITLRGMAVQFWMVLFYGALSAMIALTYLLPFAPASTEHDRILGLSATILFQVGFLLSSGANSFLWFFLIALGLSYGFFGSGSPLSLWGHVMGFSIGLLFGLAYRFKKA